MSEQLISIWSLPSVDKNNVPETLNYRQLIKQSCDFLSEAFHNKQDINYLVEQRTLFIDEVLQHIWAATIPADLAISLVAVGGYGRGQLHPYSDVDVLILLDDAFANAPPPALSAMLQTLWDTGQDIGYSVRTISECRQQAEADISTATNLLESRLLSGNTELHARLEALTHSSDVWDTKRFFEHKREEQLKRHLKYRDTSNNLEPNVKESPGGLRDLQLIQWVAQKHFDVDDLKGLFDKQFITQDEYEKLDAAQSLLWTIRFALHDLTGRKQDKLMIDHQRKLADMLGYEATESRMAVELFMKDYYRCARTVRQMNSLLLQLFEESIILADEPRDIQIINRRFQSHNCYLETINPAIFAYFPFALLEVFLILQQNPELKGIRAATIRQIHAHLHLIDDHFRNDIRNQALFMEIIRQPKGITHEFRRMNELGVLGAYLPEFGQIVGQMQHDLFHAYTVDEHTLFLVGNLRRFSCEEFFEQFPLCSKVFYELPKPELLYIAGLFHDIAKGRGGDHSVLGVEDANLFCKRHSLSQHDTELVAFLVRHHLAMSSTAQKNDLEDPQVIERFAELVGTTERLNYLYLLTVADIRATNGDLWNGWRDSLLRQLYQSTRLWIEQHEAQAKSMREKGEKKYRHAFSLLLEKARQESDIHSLWKAYDPEYFLRNSVDSLVWQTETRLDNPDVDPLITTRQHGEQDTLEVFIVTPDRPGIFAAITSALEQCQLNVLDAKINVSADKEALNTFIVNGRAGASDEIEHTVKKYLVTPEEVTAFDPMVTPRITKLFKTEPNIEFKDHPQGVHTIMTLETHDRPGLISKLGQGFLQCHTQIINAKINTMGDQVEDVFFITTESGEALDKKAQTELKEALIDSLSE